MPDTPPPEAAPTDPNEMVGVVLNSLADIWTEMLARSPFIAAGLGVLVVTWGVAAIANRVLRRWLLLSRMKRGLRDLILQLTSVAIWVTGIVISAVVIFPGMTPAKVLTGLGIGSVALGFAFKDIVENFLAGVLILWRFPFDPGDYIECGDASGTVEGITVRMTELRCVNGELLVLPNAALFKQPVIVRTSQDVRRMTEPVGVAYEADAEHAHEVIHRAVEACGTVSQDKPVEVFLDGFGASSVDFAVTWWCGALPLDERASRNEVLTRIKQELDAEGIEIPWPQQVVSFKTPLETTERVEQDAESVG